MTEPPMTKVLTLCFLHGLCRVVARIGPQVQVYKEPVSTRYDNQSISSRSLARNTAGKRQHPNYLSSSFSCASVVTELNLYSKTKMKMMVACIVALALVAHVRSAALPEETVSTAVPANLETVVSRVFIIESLYTHHAESFFYYECFILSYRTQRRTKKRRLPSTRWTMPCSSTRIRSTPRTSTLTLTRPFRLTSSAADPG